ncbi:MAG: Rieske (2Fe-2S) protein [Rhodospirillaceae bacterium]|nr:Rieske (2Fe-2S) protein [Rhodospirillaceae bacterium]|tara:strand:- start:3340 stop:4605 length:1266 start_codon:yes stop_codon:yes gene_type:complete
MTESNITENWPPFSWPTEGVTRIPFRIFSDPDVYKKEQELLFRGPVWNFLCLELELNEVGDYKTSFIGDTPIIVTKGRDGRINAMVNRCAHKGALVCHKEKGNAKALSCVYHSWTYDLTGQLMGLAFRDGLRGKGGMPDDFDHKKHRLQLVRTQIFAGMIFGTFSDETIDVEEFFGKEMCDILRRNFSRPLKLLGCHSQIIKNNWKLYAENVRDSYHATLLHTFYTTFKINRLDMDGGIRITDAEKPWHHLSFAKRATLQASEEYADANVHSASYDSKLDGPELLSAWNEFDDGITHSIQALFPTLAIQFTLNSLAVRWFTPRGVDETELFWMYLGYKDDDEEQEKMRIMQSNLTGAAGLVSLEDGCINEFVQRGTQGAGQSTSAFIEMGGKTIESSEASRATEVAIRGFWAGYKELMGFV